MKIELSYSQINDLADQINTNKGSIESEYETITATVHSLVDAGYMSAESATAYVNQFTTILGPEIEELIVLLETYRNNLIASAEGFQNLDHEIANALGI